jgi:hypothetical protein
LSREELAMTDETSKIADELQKMPYEPLLPIEKKLIAWSIGLGLFLLVVLVAVNHYFFPPT